MKKKILFLLLLTVIIVALGYVAWLRYGLDLQVRNKNCPATLPADTPMEAYELARKKCKSFDNWDSCYFNVDGCIYKTLVKVSSDWYSWRELKGYTLLDYVDANSFETSTCGYYKDRKAVYWENFSGTEFKINADPDTFIGLNEDYAKDKKNVYYWNKILVDADTKSFIALEGCSGYAKDNNYVYRRGEKIAVDPDGFTVSLCYVKNKVAVYLAKNNNEYIPLVGADPETFIDHSKYSGLIDTGPGGDKLYCYGEDKNSKYKENDRIDDWDWVYSRINKTQ